MSKQYIFIYEHITLGGTQTLIYRMAKWLKINKDCDVLVICKKAEEDSLEADLLNCGVEVKYIQNINKKGIYDIVMSSKKYDNIDFIVFHFHVMIFVEKLCQKIRRTKDTNTNVLLYAVHYNTMLIGTKVKDSILKKLIRMFYGSIISSYIENRNVAFMDELTINVTQEYYGLTIEGSDDMISRLPVFLNEYNTKRSKIKSEQEQFNILTIARAEFPFKGYIFGLIDDYIKLRSKYDNIILTIISSGADVNKLTHKIDCLPIELKGGIQLINGVPYKDIGFYIDNANLFVGMGTTILDAANYGVPSITTHSYTYKNISSGFFHEYPNVLGPSNINVSGIDLIEKVINMSEHEYEDICSKTYRALQETYEIGSVMNSLLCYRNTDCIANISWISSLINSALMLMIEIKKKIKSNKC